VLKLMEDLSRVAVKSHQNGAAHPEAHFRRAITLETALDAPMIAWPLGRFDCCAVSDGSAALILTRSEIAKGMKHKDDLVVVKANKAVRDGVTDADGEIPVNASGGLKCFGHPIGATGGRTLSEVTRQLQGRAEGMQVKNPTLGLAHNLGGPASVCSVTILGRSD
jgi:acetyl-CoA acetyltransferase